MTKFRDVRLNQRPLWEQGMLNRILSDEAEKFDTPSPDKETMKNRLLESIARAIDKKMETLEPGQGLGIVYRLEVLIPERDRKWSEAVKERDGYQCVECGETENLQAHHIKPVSEYPELIDSVDNGVTLCAECHAAKHKQQAGMIVNNSNYRGDKDG